MTNCNLKRQEPVLVLRSRISGRERWEIPLLINQPRHALALQTILASEPGILRIEANELTGRVLIHYDPEQIQDPIHNLLRKAFAFGPLSEREEQLLSAKPEATFPTARLFLGAELGCLLFKVLFLGTLCPTAGITSALSFVLFARFMARSGSRRESPMLDPTGRIVPDKPSGIEDHEDRTEIV
jgi:hypothetical protein